MEGVVKYALSKVHNFIKHIILKWHGKILDKLSCFIIVLLCMVLCLLQGLNKHRYIRCVWQAESFWILSYNQRITSKRRKTTKKRFWFLAQKHESARGWSCWIQFCFLTFLSYKLESSLPAKWFHKIIPIHHPQCFSM